MLPSTRWISTPCRLQNANDSFSASSGAAAGAVGAAGARGSIWACTLMSVLYASRRLVRPFTTRQATRGIRVCSLPGVRNFVTALVDATPVVNPGAGRCAAPRELVLPAEAWDRLPPVAVAAPASPACDPSPAPAVRRQR